MECFPFRTDHVLSDSEKEVRAWLRANKKTLCERTPDEVAHMAVLCGFAMDVVCLTLSNFRDAMQGSNIENRAALVVWNFDMAVKRCDDLRRAKAYIKELDLSFQWKELVANTISGEEVSR